MAKKKGLSDPLDRLKRLSKDDLIWVINRILQMCCLQNGEYYLLRVLSDLENEKERRRYDDAEKYLSLSIEKRKEFSNLMAPYDGMKFIDIPRDVLLKADELQKEVAAAEKKWNRLMGLKTD